jgi:RNA polymerase sigma factor (sigma-70 family)
MQFEDPDQCGDLNSEDASSFNQDASSPLEFPALGFSREDGASDGKIDSTESKRILHNPLAKSDSPGSDSVEADSVVVLFRKLSDGDESASQELWNRFFQRLATEARSQLNNQQRRVMDEDDLAAGVLHSLCVAAANSKLPAIRTRDDLWRMLLSWIRNDVLDHIRGYNRQKRGGGLVRGDSVFAKMGDRNAGGFDEIMAPESACQALIDLQDAWQHFSESLQDKQLRSIALRVLEGMTTEKIAEEINVSPRTIERKIQLIHQLWSERE